MVRFVLSILLVFPFYAYSQKEKASKDWFLLDAQQDSVQGLSVEKVYQTLLKDQPSKTVLVAVIDTGIDWEHEDLKNIVWTNEREIPDNDIDDDKNGYTDDIHGWNFIGSKSGNVIYDTRELTRQYKLLSGKYETANPRQLTGKTKKEYALYLSMKGNYEKEKNKNAQQYRGYHNEYQFLKESNDTLRVILKSEKLSALQVSSFHTRDPNLLFAKGFMSNFFKNMGDDANLDAYLTELKEAVEYYRIIADYGYNPEYEPRWIIGDHYADIHEKYYGNNNVKAGDPSHGTHVAGIIGADRKNNLGIKGIASNVKIMAVRILPDGDERDKDVANGIIYAVDNGAEIINLSFGKSISPQKKVVDEAISYAGQKGVLIIHAAGNEGEDSDKSGNYPNRYFQNGREAKNWLEVGASSWNAVSLAADFSNYGKKSVQVFAPGVQIYSTTPGNTYKNESGTSMASPAVAGVAALLKSYFPHLTAVQIKDILINSAHRFNHLKVPKPGSKEIVDFSDLSSSGGVVNAYDAVEMAMKVKPPYSHK